MEVDGIFSMIRTTKGGMATQLKRLDVISENIANANTGPDENGNVYYRKTVQESPVKRGLKRGFSDEMILKMRNSQSNHISNLNDSSQITNKDGIKDARIVEIREDQLTYDPDHPMADDQGFVKTTNVSLVEEMVDMISASRAYEANVSVINAAKQLAKKTLEI